MNDFVAHPSRWRIALICLGSFVFVAIGLWMGGAFAPPSEPTMRYPAPVIFAAGWASVILFGLCGVIAFKRLSDTTERLRIGPRGIRAAS